MTSGREAITYQVESYQPAVIRRSAVEQSPEFCPNGIDLECARDFAVAQLFAAARPNGVVSLTVFRNHLGDSGTSPGGRGASPPSRCRQHRQDSLRVDLHGPETAGPACPLPDRLPPRAVRSGLRGEQPGLQARRHGGVLLRAECDLQHLSCRRHPAG